MITEICLCNAVDIACDKFADNVGSDKDSTENLAETESKQSKIGEFDKICIKELAKEPDQYSEETEDKRISDGDEISLTNKEANKTSTLMHFYNVEGEHSSQEEEKKEYVQQQVEEEKEQNNFAEELDSKELRHMCKAEERKTAVEENTNRDNEYSNVHQLCFLATAELIDQREQFSNFAREACDTHNTECQLEERNPVKSILSINTKSIVCKSNISEEPNDNNINNIVNNESTYLVDSEIADTVKSAETIANLPTTTTTNAIANDNWCDNKEQEQEIVQIGVVQKHAKKPFSIAEWLERKGIKELTKAELPSTEILGANSCTEQDTIFNKNVYNKSCNIEEMIDAYEKRLAFKGNAEGKVNIAEIIKLQYEQHRRNVAEKNTNEFTSSQTSHDNKKRQSSNKVAKNTNMNNKMTEGNSNNNKRWNREISPELQFCKSQEKCEKWEEEEEHYREKLLELENNRATVKIIETQDQNNSNSETKTVTDNVSNISTDNRLEIQQTVVVKHVKPTIDIERLRALRNRVLPTDSFTTSKSHSAICPKEIPSFAQKAKMKPTSSTTNTTNVIHAKKEKNSKSVNDSKRKDKESHENHTIAENVSQNDKKLYDNVSNSYSDPNTANAENNLDKNMNNTERSEQEQNKSSTYMLGDEMYTTVPTHMSSAEENEVFEEISKLLLRYCLGRDEKRHTTTIPLPSWSVLPPGLAINSQKPKETPHSNNKFVSNEKSSHSPQQKYQEEQHRHVEKESHSSELESRKEATESKKSTMNSAEWPTLEEAIKQAKKHKEREKTTHKKIVNTSETSDSANDDNNNNNYSNTNNKSCKPLQHKAIKEIDKEERRQEAKNNDKINNDTSSNTNDKSKRDTKEKHPHKTDSATKKLDNVISESEYNNNNNDDTNKSKKNSKHNNSNNSSSCDNVVTDDNRKECQTNESSIEEHKYICDSYGNNDDENSLNKELELYFHLVRLYQTKKVTLRTLELVHEMLKHTRVLPHVPTMNNFSSRPITTHDPISRRRAYLQQVIISLLDEMKQEKLREERNEADESKKISLIDFDSQIKNIIKGIPTSATSSTTTTQQMSAPHNMTQMNFPFNNNNNNTINSGSGGGSSINYTSPFNNLVPPTLPITSFSSNLTPFNMTVPNTFQPNCPSSSMPQLMPMPFPMNYNPFMMPNVHMPFVQPALPCVMPHRTWPNMLPFAHHPSPALPTTTTTTTILPSSLPQPTTMPGNIDTSCTTEDNENGITNANCDKNNSSKITTIATHEAGQNSMITSTNNKSDSVEFFFPSSSECPATSTQAIESNVVKKADDDDDDNKVNTANMKSTTGTSSSNLPLKSVRLDNFANEPHFAMEPYTMGNNTQVCTPNQPIQSYSTHCISLYPPHAFNTTFFPPQNCSVMPSPFQATTPLPSTEPQALLHHGQPSELLAGQLPTSQVTPASTSNYCELTSSPSQLNAHLKRFCTAPHRVVKQTTANATQSCEHVIRANEDSYDRLNNINESHQSSQTMEQNVFNINTTNKSFNNYDGENYENDDNDDVNRQLDEYVKAIMQYVQQSEEITGEDEDMSESEHKNSVSNNNEEEMYNILKHNDLLNEEEDENEEEEKSDNDNTELSTLCTDYHITAPIITSAISKVNNNMVSVPTISKEEREVLQDVQRDFKRRMEKAQQCKEVNEINRYTEDEHEGNNVGSYEIHDADNENVDDSQLDYEIDYSNMFLHVCSESASSPCSPERMLENNRLTCSHTKKHVNEEVKKCNVENASTHRTLFKANTESDEDQYKNDIGIDNYKSNNENISNNKSIIYNGQNNKCDECMECVCNDAHARLNATNELDNNERDDVKLQIMTETDTMNITSKTEMVANTNNLESNIKSEIALIKDKEISSEDDDDDDDKSDNDSFDVNLIEEDKVIGLEVDLSEEHEESFEEEEYYYCEEEEECQYYEEEQTHNDINYNELGKVNLFDMETAPHTLINNEQITYTEIITSENVSKLQEYLNDIQHDSLKNNDQLRLSPHVDDDDVSVSFDNNLIFTFDRYCPHERANTSDVMNTPAISKMPHIKLDVGPKINNSREASSVKDMVAAALAQSADKFSAISSFSSSSLPPVTSTNANVATVRVSPSKEHTVLANRKDILPVSSSHTFANAQTSLFAAPSFNTTIFAAPEPRKMLHRPNRENNTRVNIRAFTTANRDSVMPTNKQYFDKNVNSNSPDRNSQSNVNSNNNNNNNRNNTDYNDITKKMPTQSNVKSVLKPTAAPFIPFHMREESISTSATRITNNNNNNNRNVSEDADSGNGEMLTVTGFTNDEPQNITPCVMPSERRHLHYRVTSNGDKSDSPFLEYNYLPSQWATPEMFDDWKEMMQNKQFHSQAGPHEPFDMPPVHAYRNRRSFSHTPHSEFCYPHSRYKYDDHHYHSNHHQNEYSYDHHGSLQEECYEDEEQEFHNQYKPNRYYDHGYNLGNCSSREFEPINGFYEVTEDEYGPFLDEADYEPNFNLRRERIPCQTITNLPEPHQFQSHAYNARASSRYRRQPRYGHGQELTIPPPRSQAQRQYVHEAKAKCTRDKPKIEVPLPHSAQKAREKEREQKMSKEEEEQEEQVCDKGVEILAVGKQ